MRICIDLDGVICTLREGTQSYSDVLPLSGSKAFLEKLKKEGHYVIIYTARHMKTTNSNLGLVVSRIGALTLDWLELHQIPYDEIYFGKPWADIYIDDNAIRFETWKQISNLNLIK